MNKNQYGVSFLAKIQKWFGGLTNFAHTQKIGDKLGKITWGGVMP